MAWNLLNGLLKTPAAVRNLITLSKIKPPPPPDQPVAALSAYEDANADQH
jgi:hypothetical protein